MSHQPGHPALRVRIGDRIDQLMSSEGFAGIARLLGVSGTTVSRYRRELADFTATELLHLAAHDQELGEAIITYLRGQVVKGDSADILRHVWVDMDSTAKVQSAIAEAHADGGLDRHERQEIAKAIRNRQKCDRQLLADLEA